MRTAGLGSLKQALLVLAMAAVCAGCIPTASTAADPAITGDTPLVAAVELSDLSAPTLAERMQRYGVPAVSFARIEGFEIVETGQVGVLRDGQTALATSETRFQAASVSKAVAAFAVMALVDDGRVDIDAPVNRYLRRWAVPDQPDAPVTVRHLLSHTSGLGPRSYPGLERGTPRPTLEQILTGAEGSYNAPVAISTEPGRYAYSGGGFMVLELLVEDVTGQSFDSFMQTRIFEPAAMTASSFQYADDEDEVALAHDWTGAPIERGWAEYPQAAAAGLWSSPTDLANLLVSFMRGYQGMNDGVVSQSSAQAMAQAQVEGMGLGFGVGGEGPHRHVSHAGWTIGYRSHVLAFPETGDGLVIMTNGQAGHHLIDDIIRTYGRRQGWSGFGEALQLSREDWEEARFRILEGRYSVAPAGFEIRLERAGADLELITGRGSRYRATPTGDDRLVLLETGDAIEVDWSDGTIRIWGMSATPLASAPSY
jgi:CubicO group peptidase (beta-lactamase class C family)